MAVRDLLVVAILGAVGLFLAWVLWGALGGPEDVRLAELALERVPESGVSNPVTSVLLNFRAYDTLLELAVLLAAVLGIWSTGPAVGGFVAAGSLLRSLTATAVPLLILTAGYMLWVGGHAPGGAFQAGALLAAAGVVLRLAGQPRAGLPPLPLLRGVIVLGVLVFTAVGLTLMAAGTGFLTFPITIAKWLILAIETAATLAIGATLAAAYLAGEPAAAASQADRPGGGGH
jgi:multisubunit Na+/H+ antiporter MnhB subunit